MDNFINMPSQKNVDAIAPTARIRICVGIPWDNNYNHVRLFNDRNELQNYIDSKAIYSTDNAALVKRGYAELNIPVNEVYADNANYIAFFNTGYTDKWTYGFITSIDPLSVHSCRVNFELDVWTNCQFDMILNQCFIERQIVAKSLDKIGNYTYPEGLETGQYINADDVSQTFVCPTYDERDYVVVIASTFNEQGEFESGGMRDNIYSGVKYIVFDELNPKNVDEYLEDIVNGGLSDGIINCFMIPSTFIGEEAQWKTLHIPKKYDNIDGYVPKNNKLFCYPYNFIYANNNRGSSTEYRYEFFRDDDCQFYYTIMLDTEPVLCSYPAWYNNINQNFLEELTYNSFPKCPIAVDYFKAWLAQSGAMRVAEAYDISDTGQTILAAIINAYSSQGANMGTLGGITSAVAQTTRAYMQPPQLKTQGSNNLNAMQGNQEISYFRSCIRREYAKKIDDFFTMFGYKICELGTPDISSRKSWNYVKTQGCTVSGNIEVSLLNKLRAIFDNGVTIWHTNDIGNYGLNND